MTGEASSCWPNANLAGRDAPEKFKWSDHEDCFGNAAIFPHLSKIQFCMIKNVDKDIGAATICRSGASAGVRASISCIKPR